MKDPKDIGHWIEALASPNKELSKWEMDFIESVTDQWERYHRLSDRQIEILERIYAEKTE